jgi:hypothetical protein
MIPRGEDSGQCDSSVCPLRLIFPISIRNCARLQTSRARSPDRTPNLLIKLLSLIGIGYACFLHHADIGLSMSRYLKVHTSSHRTLKDCCWLCKKRDVSITQVCCANASLQEATIANVIEEFRNFFIERLLSGHRGRGRSPLECKVGTPLRR